MFLHPLTAITCWLTLDSPQSQLKTLDATELSRFTPTDRTLSYLRANYPHIPEPYHVFVREGRRNPTYGFCFHRLPKNWEIATFYQAAPGIYAPSPEATLAFLGAYVSFHEFLFLGNVLCGSFGLNPEVPNGTFVRQPTTANHLLREYSEANTRTIGVPALAKALPYISEGAESPPEILMRMALSLPFRYGGLNVPGMVANKEHVPSRQAQLISGRRTLRPDLTFCHQGKLVSVEYDSDSVHLTKEQAAKDEAKRLALESDGFKVISIRPSQLRSAAYMEKVAMEMLRYLGVRSRPKPQCFQKRQSALYASSQVLQKFIKLR